MNIQKLKKRFVKAVSVFTLVLTIAGSAVVALPQPADAALQAVGAVNPATGYPVWYQDANGLALGFCDDPAFCLVDPLGLETFYWTSDADVVVGTTGTVSLILAMEAAYINDVVTPGDEMTFGRIRVDGLGLTPLSTYNVTHPFGTATFTTDDRGRANVFTEDIGCTPISGVLACDFSLALLSNIGPFLTWDPAVAPAAPAGTIGNMNIPHPVVGSPTGNNFFEVTGPEGTFRTTNFSVSGILADTIPPVITPTGGTPFSVTAGTAYVEPGATATDQIDPVTPAITLDPATIQITSNVPAGILTLPRPVGEVLTVTYTVTDGSGNIGTATRTVNVVPDVVLPVITVNGASPAFVLVNGNYNDAGATATDNVDGALTVTTTFTSPTATPEVAIDTAVAGAHTVTYTATDSSNNVATATRTVNVTVDATAPVITITGGAATSVTAGTAYVEQGATALDDFDGDLTAGITSVSTVPAGNLAIGTGPFTVTYTVTDASNNVATAVRTVTVTTDIVAPVITLNGVTPMNAEIGAVFTDPGATATDNVDGPLTVTAVSTVPATALVAGTGPFTVTYTATDSSNNIATLVRTVNVVADATVPVITINGANPATVLVGSVYTDAGATATDNIDGVIATTSPNFVVTGATVNTTATGTATVTYTVTDTSGNVATATRTVNVVTDATAPVITITGANPASVTIGNTYTDQGATALDDIDGDLTGSIQVTNTVNTAAIGAYSVTYVVSDLAGNVATSTRTVNVNSAPASGGGGGGGGGGGTFTPAPTRIEATNVPLVINASQSGKATYRFANGAQVEVEVPIGAVANTTSFNISQGAVTGNVPDNATGAFIINGQVFNITSNGGSTFSKQIEISIQVQNVPADIENVGVYYYDAPAGQWILIPSTYDSVNGKFTILVDHLTEFAIIKATGKPATIKASLTPVTPGTPSTPQTPGQVLGEKKYGDGNLIRGIAKKIYVIADGFKFPIHNLTELKKFAGRFIYDVDEGTLFAYPNGDKYPAKVLGMKVVNPLKGKSLIRTTDNKIFVVENGRRSHVRNLVELRKFAGLPITSVSNATLSGIPMLEDNPARAGDDGLVRGSDGRIFAIENGKKRHISSLNELRREHAGETIRNVDDSTLASLTTSDDGARNSTDD